MRGHLDLSCTDRAAETARHVGLGAVVVGEGARWTVLLAPDGRRYCITDRFPDAAQSPA
ncbi:MAG TPA: VOC family protein [Actinotalea sp.]|nr:VOC family protein [Actinotalea sp.]